MNYKEIVEMWEKGREKFFDYQFEVGRIGSLIYGFLEYKLNIKDQNKNEKILKKFPEKDAKNDKMLTTLYSPVGCVELKDNGWATFCIKLLIEISENTWPKSNFAFLMNIKQQGEKWLIKLCSEKDDIIEIHQIPDLSDIEDSEQRMNKLYSDPGLEKIWEKFCSVIKNMTINQFDIWLNQEEK